MAIKLSVVVPCYNEEKRFKDGFNHYFSYLSQQPFNWELIFVNDGSSDKTYEVMKKLSSGKKDIKIITYKKNRGKGYAIASGVKNAHGNYILFTDIDHSVPIQTIQNFLVYFNKGFPVVIGSRRVSGAKIIVRQHPVREFLGRGFTFLVNILVYRGVKDATCGFKAFKKEIAQKIFRKIKIYDWAFDAEILFLCKKYRIKIAQAPVSWRDVRGTKVSLKKDILRSFLGILKIHKNNLFGSY